VVNASNNQIGGAAADTGNLIAFNQAAAVSVESGTGNLIRDNSMFSNAGLGIDLGADGVTPNDATDADTGANNLQNYPVLTEALANSDGSTTISGSLLSAANASFTLEFFSNTACDPSGNGEGQEVIGVTNVMTAASGSNAFVVTFTHTVPAGNFISALATDANANTSEFSACVTVVAAAAPPEITWSLNDGQIELSWPALPAGWRLEAQTNPPGLGLTTNWFTLIEPLLTNQASLPIDPSQGSAFFRLLKP